MRYESVLFRFLPHKSLPWRLCFLVCVRSRPWLDWWLSSCGGFRDLLPLESRADFERLMMSGSRSLEFLASQGCTALGNLVLSRRDALLADVRGTVPVEEVARLRYSPLPLSAVYLSSYPS